MQFKNARFKAGRKDISLSIDWCVEPGQCWAILGGNASGKSTLARIISGELVLSEGDLLEQPESCLWLSLEAQQALYERELYLDETDLIDFIDDGTTVRGLLEEITPWSELHADICCQLRITGLLHRGYRRLSNGEARLTMLARALLQDPQLLILDEPFEGLDTPSVQRLHEILNGLVDAGRWIMLVVNQTQDLISRCERVAILQGGYLRYCGMRPDNLEDVWVEIARPEHRQVQLPPPQPEFSLAQRSTNEPLVELREGGVRYGEVWQFRGLTWCLNRGEHTQIVGPNGCGKSTLLGLITGDHPQCYLNDLRVFGYQRGGGESIWEIKRHIGYVSGGMRRDYRVPGTALSVVVSGLTDSIGLYSEVGSKERHLGLAWLDIIGLADWSDTVFRELSMGQQQLVLVARALIKGPPLIILDEPTEGLDDFNRFYVLRVVQRLIQAGISTLLFVSHRVDESLSCLQKEMQFVESEIRDVQYEIRQRKL